MLEEMICDAYTGFAPVFAVADSLYTVIPDHEIHTYSLVSSARDRSNQILIMETSSFFTTFYVYDNHLFYVLNNNIIRDFDGFSASTDEQTSTLHVLDLYTGEDTALTTLDTHYNSSIELVMDDDNFLYLKYVFYNEEMTLENSATLDMQIEYYALSFETHEITPVYESLWGSMYDFICKKENITYFFYSYARNTLGGILYSYNSDTDKLEAIASDILYQQFADDKIIYFSMDFSQHTDTNFSTLHKDGFYYDLNTLSETSFPYSYPYYIFAEHEDHFILVSTEKNYAEWLYMPKEEYFNGTYQAVSMLK